MAGNIIIDVKDVDKFFTVGEQQVHILKKASVQIVEGDFVIIYGPSGSGKSTLLHVLLGLEKPTTGSVQFLDQDLYSGTNEDFRSEMRKKHIGMVYQQANWIKSLNVSENIAFPLQLLGMEKELAITKAREMLKRVHLEEWADYYPTELSSGQQQRISMARALIHNPTIIVADEPTGNLDYESGEYIMELLSDMSKKDEKTIIMVTHDLDYLKYADAAVEFFDGEIVGVHRGKDIDSIAAKVHGKKVKGTNRKEKYIRDEKKEVTAEEKAEEAVSTEGGESPTEDSITEDSIKAELESKVAAEPTAEPTLSDLSESAEKPVEEKPVEADAKEKSTKKASKKKKVSKKKK